jgi:hypothetical protein
MFGIKSGKLSNDNEDLTDSSSGDISNFKYAPTVFADMERNFEIHGIYL